MNRDHLRAYLKRLPDFEDIEAEERALALACAHRDAHLALAFLVSWGASAQCADLVLSRLNELSGDYYNTLTPAAEALESRHPLAATMLLRAMIDFALREGRAKRYRHAARHLSHCESLAADITDFGAFESHADYLSRLKREHGRKRSFWAHVSD